MRKTLARLYGANPLHLLALLGCFALAGYAVIHLAGEPMLVRVLIWFAASIIGHDLILFPLYALADRSLTQTWRALHRSHPERRPGVSPVNYLRLPMLGCGLLFVVFFPGIIKQGSQTYLAATGQTQQPYLGRWLLISAAMFGVSAILYAARLGNAHRHTTRSANHHNPDRAPFDHANDE
ncbi:hypothetical protein F1D05_10525 [Kribbella qitaiheensis]|uniref:Lipoprotein n=1 Tax=Kribbella qitaiheensis TaxID=1544730 RepID=A0A7G6WW87_9ACTN|nr:hypothetical protein [Kribbella qitaiheensis]QNE18252.1 hypothetical protein F1D05_10525 [Kribbella qitaiheensis]